MKGSNGLKRWGYCLLLYFVLVLSLPAFASAHEYLEKSVPLQDSEENSSPSEIRIKFTEQIEDLSQMTVENEKGNLIIGKLSLDDSIWLIYQIPPLENGVYKVKWQVLSVDSHVTEGSFRFAVGVKLIKNKPSDTVSLDDTAVKSELVPSNHSPEPTNPKPTPTPNNLPKIKVKEKQDAVPNNSTDPTTTSKPIQTVTSSSPIVQQEPDATMNLNSNHEVEKKSSAPSETIIHEANQVHQLQGHHSDDSHSITFILLRILEIFIAISITGFIFFRYFVLGTGRSDAFHIFSLRNERIIALIVITVFAFTGILHIWFLASQLSQMGLYSEWDRMKEILSSSLLGEIAWVRPLAAAFLVALTFISYKDLRWVAWLKATCVLCITITFPLTGHANASFTYTSLSIISHTLHMLSGAVWFAGLVGLLIATFQVKKRSITLSELHAMIRHFSMVALPLIMLTVASGILLTVIRINSWSNLVQSDYGRLILIKSAITLLIFIIAAFHRLVFIPKLQQATRTEMSVEPKALRTFVLFLRWELGMSVMIFIIAGMLSTSSPP
jgi:putative copper export protein/methionine-rich copper-binding protein CopC